MQKLFAKPAAETESTATLSPGQSASCEPPARLRVRVRRKGAKAAC